MSPTPLAAAAAPALPTRAQGSTSSSHMQLRASLHHCPRIAGHVGRAAAAMCGTQHPGSTWPSGGFLRRRQPHRSSPAARLPPAHAADLSRSFEGDGEGEGSGAAPRGDTGSAAAGASFLRALSSPYDKEIFLLAIPALFRWGVCQKLPHAAQPLC